MLVGATQAAVVMPEAVSQRVVAWVVEVRMEVEPAVVAAQVLGVWEPEVLWATVPVGAWSVAWERVKALGLPWSRCPPSHRRRRTAPYRWRTPSAISRPDAGPGGRVFEGLGASVIPGGLQGCAGVVAWCCAAAGDVPGVSA